MLGARIWFETSIIKYTDLHSAKNILARGQMLKGGGMIQQLCENKVSLTKLELFCTLQKDTDELNDVEERFSALKLFLEKTEHPTFTYYEDANTSSQLDEFSNGKPSTESLIFIKGFKNIWQQLKIIHSSIKDKEDCGKKINKMEEDLWKINMSNNKLILQIHNHSFTRGPPGPKGSKGELGDRGNNGFPGSKGDRGLQGNQGRMGEKGGQGINGLKGDKGRQGETGPAGPVGFTSKGEKGDPGKDGSMGPSGMNGQHGVKGSPGVKGNVGPQGLHGQKGNDGDKGLKGDFGPQGIPGLSGPKGDKGDKGDQGIPGLRGLKGFPGRNGQKGRKGEPGMQGQKGAPAEKGNDLFVRIAGGGKRGRVEIFHKGEWGTLCSEGWDLNDAHVICRMMNFQRASQSFTFGGGRGKIWLKSLACTGHEKTIAECKSLKWEPIDCSHVEDAGISCI
ncbi:macrophage receptor MARCO [Heptranchias perlo]|uniref:macrophage receptor MARCO n=1 Tax=Heptranchias perlo TaxID=212740 RepID=UPI00355A0FBD